jgi:Domain of unknown function (DUF3883)
MLNEDEPDDEIRRLFLSVLLLRDPPPWVAFWQGDPKSLDLVVPEPERRLLEDAGMLPSRPDGDPANWAWWSALAQSPPGLEATDHRKRIGDAGEALTLAFEIERLVDAGLPDLAARVRWVAQESAAWGFDVLSFSGAEGAEATPLAIEVKSVARPSPNAYEFFLSSHEWATALRAPLHVIHFWDGVDPGPPPRARNSAPRLLGVETLASHLPEPAACGEACAWASAHIFFTEPPARTSAIAAPSDTRRPPRT